MAENGQAVSVEEARTGIASQEGERMRVIDIRSIDDFGDGHIAGAINIEDGDGQSVRSAIDETKPGADRWLVVCGDGKRSREVASDVADGEADVGYLDGGMKAWLGEKLPIQPPPAEKEFEGPKKTALY